jgi:glycosyltransferase involved in cell wall biosynthesis
MNWVPNGNPIGFDWIIQMDKAQKNLKVLYILGSRFPTSKAYGVTCRETVEALVRNSYETRILSYPSDYYDTDFASVKSLTMSFKPTRVSDTLRKFGAMGITFTHKVSWKLSMMMNLYMNQNLIREFSPNIFWTRNPEIAFFALHKYPKAHVVLEIHQRGSNRLYSRLMKFSDRLILCPINTNLHDFIDGFKHKCEVLVSPMSISEKSLSSVSSIESYVDSIKKKKVEGLSIGYIGKFAPGGYSKGIEDLVNLAQKYSDLNSPNTVFIIGGEKYEVADIESMASKLGISENNLVVQGHVRHSSALQLMKTMDVLVLPSPVTAKYDGTPIKTLEYCASGKLVIAADAKLYREVFSGSYKPIWYEVANSESLYWAIENATNDANIQEKVLQGRHFASLHTWEKRTTAILEAIIYNESESR